MYCLLDRLGTQDPGAPAPRLRLSPRGAGDGWQQEGSIRRGGVFHRVTVYSHLDRVLLAVIDQRNGVVRTAGSPTRSPTGPASPGMSTWDCAKQSVLICSSSAHLPCVDRDKASLSGATPAIPPPLVLVPVVFLSLRLRHAKAVDCRTQSPRSSNLGSYQSRVNQSTRNLGPCEGNAGRLVRLAFRRSPAVL